MKLIFLWKVLHFAHFESGEFWNLEIKALKSS